MRRLEGGALERAKKGVLLGEIGATSKTLGPVPSRGLVLSPSRFPPKLQLEGGRRPTEEKGGVPKGGIL